MKKVGLRQINKKLNKVGLSLEREFDGTYIICLVDCEDDNIVAFSPEEYDDFNEWYAPEGYKVFVATDEQQKIYDMLSDEIDSVIN